MPGKRETLFSGVVAGWNRSAAGPDTVMAALLQVVGRRFHRRVLPARPGEFRLGLAGPVGRTRLALLRQRGRVQHRFEQFPVPRAVEALVEAADPQVGKVPEAVPDKRHGRIDVAAPPEDHVVEDELVPVLNHRDGNPQPGD